MVIKITTAAADNTMQINISTVAAINRERKRWATKQKEWTMISPLELDVEGHYTRMSPNQSAAVNSLSKSRILLVTNANLLRCGAQVLEIHIHLKVWCTSTC